MIMLILVLITAIALFLIWPLILIVTRGDNFYVANGIKKSDLKIIIAYCMAVVLLIGGVYLTASKADETAKDDSVQTVEAVDSDPADETNSETANAEAEEGISSEENADEAEEAPETVEEEPEEVIVTSNIHEVIHNVEYENVPKADYSFDFDDGNAIRISSVTRERKNIVYSNEDLTGNIKANSVLGGNMLWLKDGQAVKLENVNLTNNINASYTIGFWCRYISTNGIQNIYPFLTVSSNNRDRDVKFMSYIVDEKKGEDKPFKVNSNVKASNGKFYAYNMHSKLNYEQFEGDWHYYVLVADAYGMIDYENAGDENFILGKFYVDGELKKTGKVLGMNFSQSSIYLGIDDNPDITPHSCGYDDIKFWSTALSDDAVMTMYQAYLTK